MSSSRRTFIKQSAAAVSGATLSAALPPAAQAMARPRRVAPSDQVNLAVIGAKGMGWSDARSHLKIPGVNLVALADVDRSVLTQRAEDARALKGTVPRTYDDYRKMLESKDIDAVIVGTPDHWHCLAMVDSLAAGKHVYVEKPIAHTIEECRVMQAATRRYGQMVQVGQWQRSGTHYANAIDYVRSGSWARSGW